MEKGEKQTRWNINAAYKDAFDVKGVDNLIERLTNGWFERKTKHRIYYKSKIIQTR